MRKHRKSQRTQAKTSAFVKKTLDDLVVENKEIGDNGLNQCFFILLSVKIPRYQALLKLKSAGW